MKTINVRGFASYCDFKDTYENSVRVQESSADPLDKVWVFIQHGPRVDRDGAAHLDLEQARILRAALEEWIKDQEIVDNHQEVL